VLAHEPVLRRGVDLYQGKLAQPDIASVLGRQIEIELPSGAEE
jgi:hypothetical protein